MIINLPLWLKTSCIPCNDPHSALSISILMKSISGAISNSFNASSKVTVLTLSFLYSTHVMPGFK
jgi:hypothetical protein